MLGLPHFNTKLCIIFIFLIEVGPIVLENSTSIRKVVHGGIKMW